MHLQVGSHVRNLQLLVINMHRSECTGCKTMHSSCAASSSHAVITCCTACITAHFKSVTSAMLVECVCPHLVPYALSQRHSSAQYPTLLSDVVQPKQ